MQFIDISFDALVEKMKTKLSEKDSWKDAFDGSTSTILTKKMAYMINILMYYLQRTAEENFVSTAQNLSSMYRLAGLTNYPIARPRGASGTIRLTLNAAIVEPITIPENTALTINGVAFYTANTTIIEITDTYKDVEVRQGERVTETFTTNGAEFQEFVFGSVNTTDTDLYVSAGATQLLPVDNIIKAETSDGRFELFTNMSGKPVLRLGNAVAGGLLPTGTVLTISYYDVNGSNLLDTTSTVAISVDNVTPSMLTRMTGSGVLETVEELRQNVPAWFATGQRACVKSDFDAIVRNIQGVHKVKTLDIKDSLDNPFRTAHIYVLPVGSYEVDSLLQTDIENALREKTMLGVGFTINSPVIRNVDVQLRIRGEAQYNTATCRTNIITAINNLFAPANIEFGQWVTIAEIISTLQAMACVSAVTVDLPAQNITMEQNEFVRLGAVQVTMS